MVEQILKHPSLHALDTPSDLNISLEHIDPVATVVFGDISFKGQKATQGFSLNKEERGRILRLFAAEEGLEVRYISHQGGRASTSIASLKDGGAVRITAIQNPHSFEVTHEDASGQTETQILSPREIETLNIQHWRTVATPQERRMYYRLSADALTHDELLEQIEASKEALPKLRTWLRQVSTLGDRIFRGRTHLLGDIDEARTKLHAYREELAKRYGDILCELIDLNEPVARMVIESALSDIQEQLRLTEIVKIAQISSTKGALQRQSTAELKESAMELAEALYENAEDGISAGLVTTYGLSESARFAMEEVRKYRQD